MEQILTIDNFINGPDEYMNIYRFLLQINDFKGNYISILLYNWDKQIKLFLDFDRTTLFLYEEFIKLNPQFPSLDHLVDIIHDSNKYVRRELRFVRHLIFEMKL